MMLYHNEMACLGGGGGSGGDNGKGNVFSIHGTL